MSAYETDTFPVGSFQCNCTLLVNRDTKEAIVVDPGDEAESILERLDPELTVTALWHTHAHLDHVGATLFLYDLLSKKNVESGKAAPKVYLHEGDRWLYEHIDVQSALLGLRPFAVPSSFEGIKDGQRYEGFEKMRAIHTPGHTPGSCCLFADGLAGAEAPRSFRTGAEQSAKKVLISGDTLFRGSIGRTDLWGGDHPLILSSIKAKLFSLPPETLVIPGHGPFTSVGQEKESNPFFR
ncbi:MAG: MBL fold metallo-hydrolase [Bdellovibrionales bacterium]|nr:MBL fold metallo-hydrolase [Bdellovibrionales bacterium]